MNTACRLVDCAGLFVAVGTQDQVMSFLKLQSPDGEYAVVGPGIDARFYRVDGVVYPSGGKIHGQTIPTRSRDECVATFGLAMELNKGQEQRGTITISELQDGVLICMNCDEAFASEDDDPLCPRCREFQAVIDRLSEDYPGTVDYHTENGELFELLDEDDKVIARITEREMTAIRNEVE